jgi:hypothetical protein
LLLIEEVFIASAGKVWMQTECSSYQTIVEDDIFFYSLIEITALYVVLLISQSFCCVLAIIGIKNASTEKISLAGVYLQ